MIKAYGLASLLVVAAHLAFSNSDAVWSEIYRLSVPSRDDALRLGANLQLTPADDSQPTVVLMGSSQTREDFDIDLLTKRFRGRVNFVNLGFSGNGNPIEMYMLTPSVIALEPDLVVYMPFIGSLFRPYQYSTFDMYFHPNILPLIHSNYGWRELAERSDAITVGLLRNASVLFRYRNSYQYLVDDVIRRWVTNAPRKLSQMHAYSQRKPNSHFERMIAIHKNRPRYREHRYRALYESSFHRMMQSFNAEKIPVLVIDGPTHPLIRHFYDPTLDTVYDEFFSSTSEVYGFRYLRTEELPEFGDSDFNDFTHLNASGRNRFNAYFADYLEANAGRLGIGEN